MNRLKLAFEALVLLIHLLSGAFIGYLFSINETQLEVTTSIFVSTVSMFLLWGLARLKGKYMFFEIESPLHGALAGVILTSSQTVLNALSGNILTNPVTHWLVGIFSGLLIGTVYGKFGELRARHKTTNRRT